MQAVIILPRPCRTDFLFQGVSEGDVDVKAWLQRVLEEYEADPGMKDELDRLCGLVMTEVQRQEQPKAYGYSYSSYSYRARLISAEAKAMVAVASIRLQQPKRFLTSMRSISSEVPLSVFSGIGSRLHYVRFAGPVQNAYAAPCDIPLVCLLTHQSITNAMSTFMSLHERYEAVSSLLSAALAAQQSTELEAITRWAQETTSQALCMAQANAKEDGQALVAIVEAYKGDLLDM